MKPPYDIFAERWGSQSFTDYVNKLQQQADQALESAKSVSPFFYFSFDMNQWSVVIFFCFQSCRASAMSCLGSGCQAAKNGCNALPSYSVTTILYVVYSPTCKLNDRAPKDSCTCMATAVQCACLQDESSLAHDICQQIARLEVLVWDAAMQAS